MEKKSKVPYYLVETFGFVRSPNGEFVPFGKYSKEMKGERLIERVEFRGNGGGSSN